LKATVETTRTLEDTLAALAVSADGKVVAAAGGHYRKVVLIRAATGKTDRVIESDEQVWSLCFSPDGKTVAFGTKKGKVRLYSAETGKLIREASPAKYGIHCLTFAPGGTRIAAGCEDGSVCVFDAATGKSLVSYVAHRRTVHQVAVSSDGKYVASAGFDKVLHVYDVGNDKTLKSVHTGFAHPSLSFGAGNLTSTEGTTLRVLDLKTQKLTPVRDVQ
jgi:WD40 repeat protein